MPTVLIVDDEPETVRMLATALELFGYEPLTATGGAEALARIDGRLPDAIVLDLMMPEIDGFEVARRVRANPRSAHVPIIVVTAMAEIGVEERCREIGVNHFLPKPVSLVELADLIQSSTTEK